MTLATLPITIDDAMEAIDVVRAVHFAASVLIAGTYAFHFVVLRGASTSTTAEKARNEIGRRLRLLIAWGISIGLASWLVWLALVAARMSGDPLGQALRPEVLGTVLTRTTFGQVWMFRFASMALLAADLLLSRRGNTARLTRGPIGALLATSMLAALAWAGHAAGTAPPVRSLHLAADALHLLGAGLWLGALVPLHFVLDRARLIETQGWHALTANAVRRFSALGMLAVATLALTGLINAWLLVGDLRSLVDTSYGRLVLTKVVLFAAMLAIAGINRFKLSPWLYPDRNWNDRSQAALLHLRRNVVAEVCLGATILSIVGILGAMPPSSHGHGDMPHHIHSGQ